MKILIHSHMYPSSAHPHLGTFVEFPAKTLVEMGHKVTVVSPIPWVPPGLAKNKQWKSYKAVPEKTVRGGVEIYHPRFFSIPRNYLFAMRGSLMYNGSKKLLQKLFAEEEFDVIHCHVPLPDGYVGKILSQRYNIPFVVTIHGWNIYHRIHQSAGCYGKIKQVVESADGVGVVSKRLGSLVIKNKIFPRESTFKTIYNGTNPQFDDQPVVWPAADSETFRLLSVCHLVERKGIGQTIRALAEIRNSYPKVKYYIIGDGIYSAELKRIAREVEVEDIVFFLGAMDNKRCLSYMRECDLFVLPSWNEAFGVVYIEAMYCGKACIGCLNEGIAEVIEDGKNGFLVPSKNVNALVEKLRYILAHPQEVETIGKNARDTVWPAFSWQQYCNSYLELYKQAIDSFGGP